MSKTESRIVDWLSGVAHTGESLTGWATLGYPMDPESGISRHPFDDYIEQRGLDPTDQVGLGHTQLIAILTDRRLMFVGVGGMMAIKPKQLVVEAPIDSVRLEWWDQQEVGPNRRWLLFLLGNQWLRHVAATTNRSNIDAFTTGLGDRAVRFR